MLELGLQRQAATPTEERPTAFRSCSGCGEPTPVHPEEPQEPRVVQTRGGEAAWQEPKHYCRKCSTGFFFPQSQSLGLDQLQQYSNAILAKIVHAGSNNTSYQQAETALDCLAELDVSDKQVRRLCKRIGDERIAERDAAVAAYQALPLVKRQGNACRQYCRPSVVAISVDVKRPPANL